VRRCCVPWRGRSATAGTRNESGPQVSRRDGRTRPARWHRGRLSAARAFESLQQSGDTIQRRAGLHRPHVSRLHCENRCNMRAAPLCKPAAQTLVDDIIEWTAGPSRLRTQLRGNVIVEDQAGSHVLMLVTGHLEVNDRSWAVTPFTLPRERQPPPASRTAPRAGIQPPGARRPRRTACRCGCGAARDGRRGPG